MSMDRQKARLLGEFLKSRREKLNPSEAGLPPGYGKRRTPGLRREEVAQLAHVSTTWYTWLEQGRATTPSRQVLDSIAKALKLSENEHLHVLHLANMDMPNAGSSVQQLSPDIEKVVHQLPYPAFIATDRTEVLSWNAAACRVIYDFSSLAAEDRSMAWLTFTCDKLRKIMPDWEDYAQYTAGVLRGRYEKNLNDLAFRKLIDRLSGASREFREFWSTHDIMEKTMKTIRFNHPEAGLLTFNVNSFSQINGSTNAHCCVYIPADGTNTGDNLQRLLAR
ncbi:helix-turn-helix transcriptional regulator [Paenibacillus hamazuiensis]|uniref:helix-turn-helix transcriptional regulator n=1 Tax=Paenibacillus hamazuiensis TaxID=2936508 RepID=UPI00200FB39F|nr:helix-turn-helix transcriptional regulator [Paenibacillus hamazuiensis]